MQQKFEKRWPLLGLAHDRSAVLDPVHCIVHLGGASFSRTLLRFFSFELAIFELLIAGKTVVSNDIHWLMV